MNKGLELIEAYRTSSPVAADRLGVLVHPQSVVHCLVAYRDGFRSGTDVVSRHAHPDLAGARLARPHGDADAARLDLVEIAALTFERPTRREFPALRLAREALRRGAAAPAVLNAANEVAVAAFLERRIGFLDIARTGGLLSRYGRLAAA